MRRGLRLAIILAVLCLGGCSWLYVTTDQPIAVLSASPTSGPAPLTVLLDASASTTGQGTRLISYLWLVQDAFGNVEHEGATWTYTFHAQGTFTINLTVTDDQQRSGAASCLIAVANAYPIIHAVTFSGAVSGPGLDFYGGEAITCSVMASDPDGYIVDVLWDFGDGTVGRGETVVHGFPPPGCGRDPQSRVYIVSVAVEDNVGNVTRAARALEVKAQCR